ncbi:hypothetical protein NEOKW01_0963 [Nematocida sp. AWRm80]|nr:hypothetical protein NEOKW01_0963 [Nematocida sp. AWRm80]
MPKDTDNNDTTNTSLAQERKEQGHLIKETVLETSETVVQEGIPKIRQNKTVNLTVDLDDNNPIVSKIPSALYSKEDSVYGTSLQQKSKAVLNEKLNPNPKSKKIESNFKRLGQADEIIKKLTIYYFKNRDYIKKTDKLVKILSKLDNVSIQRIFLHLLYRSDNPYVVLYVIQKMESIPPFLSGACTKELMLFTRSLKETYTDTVEYTRIIHSIFEKCNMPDVTIEQAFGLFSELSLEESVRKMFIELYGKIHVLRYYQEVMGGIIQMDIRRELFYSLIYVINDQEIAKKEMSIAFKKLDEYTRTHAVEKCSVVIARALWALVTTHPDAFDKQFDKLLSYISYYSSAFTKESCDILSVNNVNEMIELLEVLSNAVINRTTHTRSTQEDSKRISNYVKRSTLEKKTTVRIIPEKEEVQYTDKVTTAEDNTNNTEDNHSEDDQSEDRLNNVAITRQKLVTFLSIVKKKYDQSIKQIQKTKESKQDLGYSKILLLVAHTKLSHLLMYLSHISGSDEISFKEHYKMLCQLERPVHSGKETEGLDKLSDILVNEKWMSLGYLARENLITIDASMLSKDLMGHKSPIQLFKKISSAIHLVSISSIGVFLSNRHIYDVIYLITLPLYVRNENFLRHLKQTVSILVSTAEKEAICLLIRQLIELDSFYSELEKKQGEKKSRALNDYTAAKPTVRNTIASLFITDMDLATIQLPSMHAKKTKGYDIADVQLKQEKTIDPQTGQEEYKTTEEIIFKTLGTDKQKEHDEARTFYQKSIKDKNVDQMRRQIIYKYLVYINDQPVTEKIVLSLCALFTAVRLTDKFTSFILKTLSLLITKTTLSLKTIQLVQDKAQKLFINSKSKEIKQAAKYLYITSVQESETPMQIDTNTFEGLSLALLILITTKKGDINHLKDTFFKLCSDLQEGERNELLLLFSELNVSISKQLTGQSTLLKEYKATTQELTDTLPSP